MTSTPSAERRTGRRTGKSAAIVVLAGLFALPAVSARAQIAHRVADINVDSPYATWGGVCSEVDVRVAAEFAGFVLADETGGSCGLYRVAADASGVVPVAGPPEFGARASEVFGRAGPLVYFAASTATTGYEPWRSDGTAAGTYLLDDTVSGPGSIGWWFWLEAAEPTSYFVRSSRGFGVELWATDGTPAGTRMVRDIWPGGESGVRESVRQGWGGLLFFVADDGVAGPEVWRTDSTAAGTFAVTELPVPPEYDVYVELGALPDAVLILSRQAGGGPGLWRSDGTATGTTLIWSGTATGYWDVYPLSRLGDLLLFAIAPAGGLQIWKSDGTPAGTRLVVSLPASPGGWFWGFYPAGDRAIFFADDLVHGLEPWVTDGTNGGTHLLFDVRPGPEGSLTEYGQKEFGVLGDLVLMLLDDGVHGRELWRTDGTPAGTALVADLAPGSESAAIGSLQGELGGFELFTLALPGEPKQLWRTDGTGGGTSAVSSLGGPLTPSFPDALTDVGALAFFTAAVEPWGAWPWRTDGTEGGTSALTGDLQGFHPDLTDFVALDGGIAIANSEGDEESLIWSSAGDDILPLEVVSYYCGDPRHGCGLGHAPPSVGPVALFGNWSDGLGAELWATDGSLAGTGLWIDLLPGPESSGPRQIVDVGDEVWFTTLDAGGSEHVWRTQATPASAEPFADLGVVPGYERAKALWPLDVSAGRFFFLRYTFDGEELGFVDGVGSSPVLLRSGLAYPALLGTTGTRLLFRTSQWVGPETGEELWVSDGTPGGTGLLRDIWSGASGSQLEPGAELGGNVYFTACEPAGGCEPWRSDGTTAGTECFLDLEPGPASSSPSGWSKVDGRLYFSACTLEVGCEAWVTDGSRAGTHRLAEIAPGPYPSFPVTSTFAWYFGPRFERSGGLLYFAGDDGTGTELWAMPIELFYDGFETGDVTRWSGVGEP